MRLDVDVIIRLKNRAPFLTTVFFELVDVLAAAVIPPGSSIVGSRRRVALCIFVREAGTHSSQYIVADKILTRYQLDIPFLPLLLLIY